MTLDTTVKRIHESMRGAPVLKRAAGTLVGLLDAFLVNGWGMVTAVSASISAGECTMAVGAGNEFEDGCVVLIAGATPSQVNGEHRLTQGGTTIKFDVDASDGPVTGTVTVKYAPCGWEKAYSGSNQAVYRGQNVAGNRRYLRVVDSNVDYARVTGYNAMTTVSAGTGPFPSSAQFSGGLYWHKSDGYTTADQRYDCVGDDRAFYYAPAPQWVASGGTSGYEFGSLVGFFDPVSLASAGDAYCTTITGASSYWADGEFIGNAGLNYVYSERQFSGVGTSLQAGLRPVSGASSGTSGSDGQLGEFPDGISNVLFLSALHLTNGTANYSRRAILPGVWYVPHSNLPAHPTLQPRDTVPGPGALASRKFMLLWLGSSYKKGGLFIDVSGPWR